jgi:DNA modification methylase
MLQLHNKDCLEVFSELPRNSVNLIFADLPYGITGLAWDSIIPLSVFWDRLRPSLSDDWLLLATATQPFASAFVMSNIADFRYSVIWEKQNGTNPMMAKKRPLNCHEEILVFGNTKNRYSPQMTSGKPYKGFVSENGKKTGEACGGMKSLHRDNPTGDRYPRSVIKIPTERKKLHPTAKPTELLRYLLKTYSLPHDVVLDPTMGSGVCGAVCKEIGLSFIGIESDPAYFSIAEKRIALAGGKGET